ncbi:ABC transporter substrate-binding protein [Ruminococcaceae bacterium OttesenSCG-928-A16]|nr:ABC transporter substrate-binding protein [Ruminococcaceae bacterium OttesenSCG-928-A16]
MKKALSLLLAAALATSVLAACGGGGKSTEDNIVIGGLAPLTGSVSQYGIAASNGAKLAVKEINEAGGVLGKQVQFVLYDEKGDATEAVSQYTRLVQSDKIVALVGDVTTKPTIAVAQKAVQDNMPMITPTGTGAAITQTGPNIFRACFTDPYQGEMMAHYAQEKLSAKTAAVLYDTGDDYSVGVAEAFEATAKTLGIEVTAYEGYQTGATDFNAQLTKIKEGNPDVIMVPCYYEDAAKVVLQARQLGVTSKFLGSDGWDGVLNQLDASNYEVLNDSFYCNQYSLGQPGPELEKFIKAYTEEFGADTLNMFAVLGYEAMHLMGASIEKAGSTDSDAIVDAMKNLDYDGVSGNISYKGGNDPVREAYIIEFENGTEKILGTYSF